MVGSFLLAFFGSAFFAGKYMADKASMNNYRAQTDRQFSCADRWIESKTSSDLEHKISEHVKNNRPEALRKLHVLCPSLPASNYFAMGYRQYSYDDTIAAAITRILMAEYGAIPRSDAQGILYYGSDPVIQCRFMKAWDSLLQKKGFPPMVFATPKVYNDGAFLPEIMDLSIAQLVSSLDPERIPAYVRSQKYGGYGKYCWKQGLYYHYS